MTKKTGQKQKGIMARMVSPLWRRTRGAFRARPVLASLLLTLLLVAGTYRIGLLDTPMAQLDDATTNWAMDAGLVVENIVFRGQVEAKPETLQEALGIAEGAVMHQLKLDAAKDRVEAISWVKTATISRAWPNTLVVNVEERTPFAIWQIDGVHWLLDETGTRLSTEAVKRYAGLPFIVGAGAPERAPALLALIGETPDIEGRIRAMVRVGERRWDIEFDTGARLRLPEDAAEYGMAEAWGDFVTLAGRSDL